MRPGPPPPPRPQRKPLGPTPRYAYIPPWSLTDNIAPSGPADETAVRKGVTPVAVRGVLLSAVALFGIAASVHVLRYGLLLFNRTSLLPRLVANGALLLGVLASLAALVAVVVTAVALTSWLVARRAAVFKLRGQDDPRPVWTLWAGCLIPLVNLVWAPVFVIELANAEDSRARLRTPIGAWWVGWVLSTAVTVFAIATSFTTQPQGIADNTVAMIVAYLLGMAVLMLLWRVFDAFVRKPVERPLHRWVVVDDDQPVSTDPEAESSSPVEPERQEPAA